MEKELNVKDKGKEKEKEGIKKSDEGRGRKDTNYGRLNDEHDQFRVRSCDQFLSIDRVLKYILHKREERLVKNEDRECGQIYNGNINPAKRQKRDMCENRL